MQFKSLPITGAYKICSDPFTDERGEFSRIFCRDEFREMGLESEMAALNRSISLRKSTLRGLHYQLPPGQEAKLVWAARGSFWDVIVDLRPESPDFRRWHGQLLDSKTGEMIYVPAGCAHGVLSMEDHAELQYLSSSPYQPELERGVMWNDPEFNISWPMTPICISEKDQNHPPFDLQNHLR